MIHTDPYRSRTKAHAGSTLVVASKINDPVHLRHQDHPTSRPLRLALCPNFFGRPAIHLFSGICVGTGFPALPLGKTTCHI